MTTYKITPKVKYICPNTRKKSFIFFPYFRKMPLWTYWKGGSQSSFSVYNVLTNKTHYPETSSNPSEFGGKEKIYYLTPGDILIDCGIFLGKPACPKLYCKIEDEKQIREFLGITQDN